MLQGNILQLEAKWNFQWQYRFRVNDLREPYKQVYLQTEKDPWIIHYAGGHKPWLEPELENASYFWDYAMETPCFKEIVYKALSLSRRIDKRYNTYRFPYEAVRCGSRVVLYAAGVVGESFYEQLYMTHYARMAFWVDKRADRLNEQFKQKNKEHYWISGLDRLCGESDQYDYVVIAVKEVKVGNAIKDDLRKLGIPEHKIVFCDYVKSYRNYSC